MEIENNIKKRLHTIFSIPNERVSFNKSETREYEDECIEEEEEEEEEKKLNLQLSRKQTTLFPSKMDMFSF